MKTALYTRIANVPVVSEERTYVLKIRDVPEDDRPRERLIAKGPAALSSAELLAVILNTGTQKEDVLAMSARIMKEYGEKSIMVQKDAAKLSTDLGIPAGKAAQIVAVSELGRRFFAKNDHTAPTIRTAREAFAYVADIRTLPKEHLRGIYLNSHYKVIHDEVISIGTLDANIIHPRDVFKPALEYSAAAVILAHNHPSGSATPSAADIAVTEQLVKAGNLLGIELIDHIVVTKNGFASVPVPYH